MAKPPAQLGAWDAQEEMDETGVVKQRRRLLPTVTECYFQGTVQYFDGISRGRCLSMVFCGSRSLSMLPNQFSLFITPENEAILCRQFHVQPDDVIVGKYVM